MKSLIQLLFIMGSVTVRAEVAGHQILVTTSPNGVQEKCIRHRLPGADYREKDSKKEAEFCSIDLYNGHYAICAKTWSTSPGSVIYNISSTGLTVSRAEDQCQQLNNGRVEGAHKVAKFKNTMNARGTSGTYSQSSLIYYHISRYFGMLTDIPVSVYRSIDREQHLNRVALRASRQGRMGKQMKAGWRTLIAAEQSPSSYSPTDELFTDNQRQIYGILIRGRGERYGAEVNGIRSKWGLKQNIEFTQTAPFMALQSEKNLNAAIQDGLVSARKNRKLREALGGFVSNEQMIFWMTELAEVTLMDYIFSQQDRIGNIDYRWYWVYVKNDVLSNKREKSLEDSNGDELPRKAVDFSNIQPPSEIAEYQPVLIQKTQLNDNDAGTRKLNTNAKSPYVNYTKRAKMLEKIKHYPARLYSKLVKFNDDLQTAGVIWQFMSTQFDINPKYLESARFFANEALEVLRKKCENKELIFDLNPKEYLITGATQPKRMDCQTGDYQ